MHSAEENIYNLYNPLWKYLVHNEIEYLTCFRNSFVWLEFLTLPLFLVTVSGIYL